MQNNFLFFKEEMMINRQIIKELVFRFNDIIKANEYRKINNNISDLNIDDISKEPLFLNLLENIQEKFKKITGFNDLKFDKLWLVPSFFDEEKPNLPYLSHIDKKRYLKAMVYLHDITVDHGPIHFAKANKKINIEQLRKKLPKDYKKKLLNVIDDNYLHGKMKPMTGRAGDVVFFDTNTPHKAGIIKSGFYRKIIRLDFERPFFNTKPSLLSRFINKLKLS